ncbi:MAG TPA: ABC transporter permease subunit [Actinomycetota bacterium]|nr:ABC transporter permease subunit [Actinomycetota bacterium]
MSAQVTQGSRWSRVNPVLAREVKERMRRRVTPILLTVYLLLVVGVFNLGYKAITEVTGTSTSCVNGRCFSQYNVAATAGIGRSMFQSTLFFILVLVCFIVPALTSGAIAGERERQTLVPLQLTLLRPRSILLGKLFSSIAFMVFLILATIPLIAVTFVIGGVGLFEVVLGVAMVIASAVAIGSISIMCSTFIRRSQGATVAAYGLVFALTVGTFVPLSIVAAVSRSSSAMRPTTVAPLAANPFAATASVIASPSANSSRGESPFSPLQYLMRESRRSPSDNVFDFALGKVPFWLLSLMAMAGMSAASIALAAKRLQTPAPKL